MSWGSASRHRGLHTEKCKSCWLCQAQQGPSQAADAEGVVATEGGGWGTQVFPSKHQASPPTGAAPSSYLMKSLHLQNLGASLLLQRGLAKIIKQDEAKQTAQQQALYAAAAGSDLLPIADRRPACSGRAGGRRSGVFQMPTDDI